MQHGYLVNSNVPAAPFTENKCRDWSKQHRHLYYCEAGSNRLPGGVDLDVCLVRAASLTLRPHPHIHTHTPTIPARMPTHTHTHACPHTRARTHTHVHPRSPCDLPLNLRKRAHERQHAGSQWWGSTDPVAPGCVVSHRSTKESTRPDWNGLLS